MTKKKKRKTNKQCVHVIEKCHHHHPKMRKKRKGRVRMEKIQRNKYPNVNRNVTRRKRKSKK